MGRFLVTRAGIIGVWLALLTLAGPVAAANTNLTATARYSASSEWESNKGNTAFVAAKAFDGDLTSRWNVAGGNDQGSWLTATWNQPVTINKVIVREAFDRLNGFRIMRLDPNNGRWLNGYVAEGAAYSAAKGGDPDNPTFTIRLSPPVRTAGLRVLFTQVRSSPSIFEVEAYDNPAGTLSGTVTDPSGHPVEAATVRAGEDSTTTDTQGRYTLLADAGSANVVAGKTGFFRERVARGVVLPADGAARRDFVLLPLPPNMALAATAVSSSDWEDGTDYDAAKANDGRLSTRWNAYADDGSGATLEMQWPQAQTFNEVTMREAFDRIRNFSLMRYDEISDTYIPVANADVARGRTDPVVTQILPAPVTTRRLRLMVNVTDAVPSIYELEVRNTPFATVKGVVRELASGRPVRRAAIVSDAGEVLGTANDQGEFTLRVEPGDYALQAVAEGYYGTAPVAVSVDEGETREISLTAAVLGTNVAVTARAVASSEAAGGANGAANVNDGDPGTVWLAKEYANQWVALLWDRPVHLTAIQLRGFQGVIQGSYLQVLGADGKSWVDLPDTRFSPQFLGSRLADFFFPQGIATTGVRYFITATHSTDNIPGLGEMLVYDSSPLQP